MTRKLTANEFAAIRAMRVDTDSRRVARLGGILSLGRCDELGDDHIAWLRERLDLGTEITDRGLVLTPKAGDA